MSKIIQYIKPNILYNDDKGYLRLNKKKLYEYLLKLIEKKNIQRNQYVINILYELDINNSYELLNTIDYIAQIDNDIDLINKILYRFFYTQRELLETLILSIIENNRYRFTICFMDISRNKRLVDFSFNHETSIEEILKKCRKNDFKEILLRLTKEELLNIYTALEETSGGGRMRIKKVIRKY